jgi:hypothetical protein
VLGFELYSEILPVCKLNINNSLVLKKYLRRTLTILEGSIGDQKSWLAD